MWTFYDKHYKTKDCEEGSLMTASSEESISKTSRDGIWGDIHSYKILCSFGIL